MSWQGVAVTGLLVSSVLFSKFTKKFPRDLIFTIAALLTAVAGIISSKQIYQSLTSQAILTAIGFWIIGRAVGTPRTFFSHQLPVNCILLASLFFSKLPVALVLLLFSLFLLREGQFFRFPQLIVWKRVFVLLFYFAAVLMIIAGFPIGTIFFWAAMVILLMRPFPVVDVVCKEFPLPRFLELFSATLFFFAINSSRLNHFAAGFVPASWPFAFTLTLFALAAQGISFLMPRPVAFAALFSVVLSLFSGHPNQIVISGIVLGFSTAFPFFLKSQLVIE